MFNLSVIYNYLGLVNGHERTIKAKKNIIASFVIKGLNIIIGLFLVRLTINYLNPTKYGIWITLSSIIGWFTFFDIGLGNGLRNKFTEALALSNHRLAKTYVSTTYAVLSIIIAIVLLLFYIINPFLNWASILNAGDDPALQKELAILALIVFTFFCLRFIFQLIATILIADQQPAKASLFNLYTNVLSLILIIILTKMTNGSLLYLGIIVSSLPVFVFIISSFWFYKGKYKIYKPSVNFVDFNKAKELFSLGIKFFFIQIAGVLLYQTNNIIIAQVLSPTEVTPYNVALKYFSIIMMIFSILVSPFWSAFTEAWMKDELKWIKSIIKKLIRLWFILIFIVIIMMLGSQWAYSIWIGNEINIPLSVSILVGISVIINIWNAIFSQFLNGVGKIKLQLWVGISAALLNVPLAIIMGKTIGVEGILLANITVLIFSAFLYPIQYRKLIYSTAKGIWSK